MFDLLLNILVSEFMIVTFSTKTLCILRQLEKTDMLQPKFGKHCGRFEIVCWTHAHLPFLAHKLHSTWRSSGFAPMDGSDEEEKRWKDENSDVVKPNGSTCRIIGPKRHVHLHHSLDQKLAASLVLFTRDCI